MQLKKNGKNGYLPGFSETTIGIHLEIPCKRDKLSEFAFQSALFAKLLPPRQSKAL